MFSCDLTTILEVQLLFVYNGRTRDGAGQGEREGESPMNFQIEQLAEAMLSGNYSAAWELLRTEQEDGKNNLYIYGQLLTPAMRLIGDLWEQNAISVADEHLASAVCDRLLSQYSGIQPVSDETGSAGNAMFLCMEDEMHYLGLKMASAYFRDAGWSVRYYGPNLPVEYALLSALSWKPQVICISATMIYGLPKLTEYVKTFEHLIYKPIVMIGGRLVGLYDLRPYCSNQTVLIPDINELQQWMADYQASQQLYKSNQSLG